LSAIVGALADRSPEDVKTPVEPDRRQETLDNHNSLAAYSVSRGLVRRVAPVEDLHSLTNRNSLTKNDVYKAFRAQLVPNSAVLVRYGRTVYGDRPAIDDPALVI
jgi:hypothetical protein